MLDQFIIDLMGQWVTDYPYIYATAEFIFIIISFLFLYNLLYWLCKLIAGDRY